MWVSDQQTTAANSSTHLCQHFHELQHCVSLSGCSTLILLAVRIEFQCLYTTLGRYQRCLQSYQPPCIALQRSECMGGDEPGRCSLGDGVTMLWIDNCLIPTIIHNVLIGVNKI